MPKASENIIDLYVKFARKLLSKCSCLFDDFDCEIVKFLKITDIDAYGFIIDSYYLLEDTQLAKENYKRFGPTGPTKYENFGEVYLRVYGVLNACYQQQQAILQLCEKLGVKADVKEIKEFTLFDLRNTFASHTVSRGYNKNKCSYILDRHSLIEGKLEGYSSNHKSAIDFKKANIEEEINKWDILLASYLNKVSKILAEATEQETLFESISPMYSEVFERIDKMHAGGCHYSDVWDESAVCFVYK